MRPTSELLALLVCPSCGSSLGAGPTTETASDGHVIEGRLDCAGCAAQYPIRGGIPRFLPSAMAASVEATVEGFGFQWKRANQQLKDTRFSAPEVFLDFIAPVDRSHFVGKTVLDAGCGFGRFTKLAAEFGAARVVGVDLSESVEPAFENTRHLPNVLIVQADLFALPFARVFDYAFSVGVLHHTADPAGAFVAVSRTVKPHGTISAWVYGREGNGWIIYMLNPVRHLTSRMPRRLLLGLAHVVGAPLWLATKFVYRPLNRSTLLKPIGQRLFYAEYMVFLSQFGYRDLSYIVFDHAVPQLAAYVPRDEFEQWFATARVADASITRRGGNSWRGFGTVKG